MNIIGFTKNTFLDYKDKIASIIFIGGCNLRCPYCHNANLVTNNPSENTIISQEYIMSFLKKRKGLIEGVVISGGEPTLDKNSLIDLCKNIKSLGYDIKLDTNGSSFATTQELINRGLINYVALDYKAPLRKYNLLCPQFGFDTTELKKTLKLLLSDIIDYEIRSTLTMELLPPSDLLELAYEIKGAKLLYLQNYVSRESCFNSSLTSYSVELLNKSLNQIKEIIPNTYLR